MKEVFINGRFLTQEITGVQRVGIETLKELQKKSEIKKITILVPSLNLKVDNDFLSNFNVVVLKNKFGFTGHLWEQLNLGPYIKKRKGLLINFCNTAPIFLRKQIVYIHDTAVFEHGEAYDFKFILWYKIMYKFLKKNKIVTVSDFSNQQLRKFLGIKNISTIYNGVNHLETLSEIKNQEILKKLGVEENEFYLTVGSKNPNKNQKIIEKLSTINLDKKFIIVGAENKNFSETSFNGNSNCIYTGYISDNDLNILYKNAKVFIFPSLYEGFGIPPFEALMNNTPVISSNKASLKELLEDYAILINPQDLNNLNKIINSEESEGLLKRKLSVFKNSPIKYTWDKSADQLKNIILKEIL